jgi:signal transduction histidine kinase/CheY-like chemotaxis protein/ABC-type amino acid transport substrate-binding protein
MDDDYPPYIFRAPDGSLKGILVDQWALWEKHTGIQVRLEAMAWAKALHQMNAGDGDVIDTMFINEQRKASFDFGDPYAQVVVPIFFSKDLSGIRGASDLSGFIVGAKRGDNSIDILKANGITNIILFDSYQAVIEAARDGRIKVFTVDKPPALYYLIQMGIQDQFRESAPLYSGELHRAVRKGGQALLDTVEGGFKAITRREYQAIDRRWFGVPLITRRDLTIAGSIALASAGLLGLLLLWVWLLRRNVRQRTEAQGRLNRELRAVSMCNQTLLRTEDEQDLLGEICRIVCQEAGYHIAWVGYAEHDPARTLRPVVWAGAEDGSIQQVAFTWADPDPGPASRAIRTGATVCIQDFSGNPQAHPWSGRVRALGARSTISLPLRAEDATIFGVLCIFSTEANAFSNSEIRLLEELAGDLAFGIMVLRARLERNRTVAALAESESQNRAMISAIPDLVFTFSRDGRYQTVHASDPALLCGPAEVLIDQNVGDILPRAIADAFLVILAEALDQNSVRELNYMLPLAGEEKYFEARVAPCASDMVIAIVRDVTEHKRSERQQHHLQAQLQQAQKMESLGSLAGGVAHDMNNVLGAILGLASASFEGQPDGRVRQALGTIIQAAERGGKMVQSLLSFARQSPAEVHELDLNGLLRDEVHLLEHTTLSKVRLELDLAPGLAPVSGDASALTHAFMNLCVNAVDAMGEGGTLTLRSRNLGDDQVEIQVRDNGSGMPREVLDKALDPFFTTKKAGKGTGLGLSMAYSTVKAHHGQLELQSEPGRGTCVLMRFPAAVPAAAAAAPAAETRVAPAGRGLDILLVDDDELIQTATEALLEILGHRTRVAASGEAALRELESFRPDLVILDMNMPGLGGAGTLPRIRALLPAVPVLLATGRADQAAMDLIAAHQGVTLLSKPFSMAELNRHLAAVARPGTGLHLPATRVPPPRAL